MNSPNFDESDQNEKGTDMHSSPGKFTISSASNDPDRVDSSRTVPSNTSKASASSTYDLTREEALEVVDGVAQINWQYLFSRYIDLGINHFISSKKFYLLDAWILLGFYFITWILFICWMLGGSIFTLLENEGKMNRII